MFLNDVHSQVRAQECAFGWRPRVVVKRGEGASLVPCADLAPGALAGMLTGHRTAACCADQPGRPHPQSSSGIRSRAPPTADARKPARARRGVGPASTWSPALALPPEN